VLVDGGRDDCDVVDDWSPLHAAATDAIVIRAAKTMRRAVMRSGEEVDDLGLESDLVLGRVAVDLPPAANLTGVALEDERSLRPEFARL
jgi:hypothetical protein